MNALKKTKGFTLTEAAIVLGALGLLLGGVWAAAGSVWDSYRLRRVEEDLFQTVQNVQNHYAQMGQLPAGGELTQELDDDARRLFPVSMRLNKATHRGDINHELATIAGGSFKVFRDTSFQFRTEISGLNKDSCMNLLMRFPVLLPELGVRGLSADGGTATVNPHNPAQPSAQVELPMSVTTASTWCSDPTTNTVNYVFTIRP